MRRIWKTFRIFIIPFVATAAIAQTVPFKYKQDHLPKLLISFASPSGFSDGTCGDGNLKPFLINSDAALPPEIDNLCNNVPDADQKGGVFQGCFGGNDNISSRTARVNKRICKESFQRARSALRTECDYITAYKVGTTYSKGLFGYSEDNIYGQFKPCIVDIDNVGGCEEANCTGGEHKCTKNSFTIKFQVHRGEGGCAQHESTDGNKCPACFDDRGQYYDNRTSPSDNLERDMTRNPNIGIAAQNGGYIKSQGCMEQTDKNPVSIDGFSPGGLSIPLGSVLNNISGSLNLFLPKCLIAPQSTDTTFTKFENYGNASSNQQKDVYDVIDNTYNSIVTPATPAETGNPYKGNCGRGKFFYTDLPPFDSNLDPQVKMDPNARISSNDIWESKTGCYDPEERFVILPTGKVSYDTRTLSLQFHDSSALNARLDNLTLPVLTEVLTDPVINEKVKNMGMASMSPTDDTTQPWDEYYTCGESGAQTPNCIDTSKASATGKLIPNDRLLMRHPMCVKLWDPGLASANDLADVNAAYRRKFKATNNLFTPDDVTRIEQYGSSPVCLGDDRIDERRSFCEHYFAREYKQFQHDSIPLKINLQSNYSKPSYVFDYNSFCWTKASKPRFYTFDPYEHWLPLAIKPDNPNAGNNAPPRMDVFGNQHTYVITDYKRSNFTKYAERQLRDDGNSSTTHAFTSLEEYGYRDKVIPRDDYSYAVYNTYAPDAANPPERTDVDVAEKMGRKAKMQECLGLYLEKYAFEGDKGAIVLDSAQGLLRDTAGGVTPDASMCQWVAYYDTSDNYGDGEEGISAADKWTQRNLFKATMLYYFNNVQASNQKYRKMIKDEGRNCGGSACNPDNYNLGFPLTGIKIPIINVTIPFMALSTSRNSGGIPSGGGATIPGAFPGEDPERLRSSSTNDASSTKDPTDMATPLAGSMLGNMNDNGFRRRRGLRPEIFDYYNFLSFSSVGVMSENLDLTNATAVGDGNPLPDIVLSSADGINMQDAYGPFVLGTGEPLTKDVNGNGKYDSADGDTFKDTNGNNQWDSNASTLPSAITTVMQPVTANLGPYKKILAENLYTPLYQQLPTDVKGVLPDGWQANMERRNCNSVVPPHFWKDVIKPFASCDFDRGAKMINDLSFSLSQSQGNPLSGWASGALAGLLNNPYKHWMTTDIDKPVLSLLTPRPGLPTFATGMNFEHPLYFKNTHDTVSETFVFPQSQKNCSGSHNCEGNKFYVYDTWMGRSGGRPIVKANLVDDPWISSDTTPEVLNGVRDSDENTKRQLYSDAQWNYGDYDSWAEVPINVSATNFKLGILLIDEKKKTSSREWVDHTWTPRTCMHAEPIDLLGMTVGKPKLDPNDPGLMIGMIDEVVSKGQVFDGSGNLDSDKIKITTRFGTESDFLNPANLDARGMITLPENHDKWINVRDAWNVYDDMNTGIIPIFKPLNKKNSSNLSLYTDNKQMGGFQVFDDKPNYFEWLPHAWSLSVGLNKAFWCEFEVPYNPYFTGDDDRKFNKTSIASHFPINSLHDMFLEEIPKAEYKPKLNFYRVERIRDTCGPFGARSTWIDDPNKDLGRWLIGNDADSLKKASSRCAGWLDIYKKGVTDPKIISWRLPRFDYEFLKAFLECTGPIRPVGKSPCEENLAALAMNKAAAQCHLEYAALNIIKGAVVALGGGDPTKIQSVECDKGGTTCGRHSCTKESDGSTFSIAEKIIDDLARWADYSSRGDTYYGQEEDVNRSGVDNKYSDPLYALEGFRDYTKHSTMVQKFWLRDNAGHFQAEDKPFGFWCNCPADDPITTRCREDFCTTEQHVLAVGRSYSTSGNTCMGTCNNSCSTQCGTDADCLTNCHQQCVTQCGNASGSSVYAPIAISTAPGPFGRWLSCYYQARARACPILTREVSDTPSYSTLVDPFPQDKVTIPGVTEATSKGQNFNVCTVTSPNGMGDAQMDQFLRWMHEEPNHLARLPVWFESSGGGYRHQDLMFYTQTRDYEAPFMEMAVPFPIDLITRDSSSKDRDVNALGEVNQREGTYKIDYNNPRATETDANIKNTVAPNNEIASSNYYEKGFRSSLLKKTDVTKIQPTEDGSLNYVDSLAYNSLYTKYLKGLYAASKSYMHGYTYKPLEPDAPDAKSDQAKVTDNYRIDPRSQETIVGPRGCDIGGWYEMMLYQARCIRFFKLNCICDYDKTFARGSDLTYALGRAGMNFRVSRPAYRNFIPDTEVVASNILPEQGQARNMMGMVINKFKQLFSSNVSNTASSARNQILGRVRTDSKGRPYGKASGVDVNVDNEPIKFPLANRGVVGPEFANAISNPDKKFTFTGLNNVMIGDLVIWDETLKTSAYGQDIDVGYPRHIAYVKSVVRNVNQTKDPLYIIVSEKNWGKDLDSCGNTDMWNLESERVIWNPSLQGKDQISSVYVPLQAINLGAIPVSPKDAIKKYASCQNADWAVCVEKYWDQVKLYRPYKVNVAKYAQDEVDVNDPSIKHDADDLKSISVEPDPDYQKSVCKVDDAAFPQPLSEKRIMDLAKNKYHIDTDIENALGAGTEFNLANVRLYVNKKILEFDPNWDMNNVMYDTDKWKLLATDTSTYAIDEVLKFLNNPLFGGLDRCDPPIINQSGEGMRENFDSVRRDAILKANAKE